MFELGMESVRNLQAFVTGMFGLDRFYEWLVDKEYDDSLPSDERDALASIRLVALEVTEGMRSPGELEMSTMALLKASVGSRTCARPGFHMPGKWPRWMLEPS